MLLSHRAYLFYAFAALFTGLAGSSLLVVYKDPASSQWYVFAGLYAFSFAFFFGAGMYVLFYVSAFTTSKNTALHRVSTHVRQSLLLALSVDTALLFQSLHVLNWLTVGLLVAAIGILELYFLNR